VNLFKTKDKDKTRSDKVNIYLLNNFNNKIKNKMNILIKASKIQIRIKSKIKIGKLKLNKGIKEKDLSVPQFGGTVPLRSGGGSSVATGNGSAAFYCLI
jgi:hypothetical protein